MNASHPRPGQNRLIQYGAAALLLVMLLAAALQVVLALLIQPGLLFLLTALLTLALIPFVLTLTTATPPISVDEHGLTITPVIWKSHVIPWAEITALKPYPLLPQENAEVTRRMLVGRKKYRPVEGVMLVIPALPVQYRIIGVLAGEGWTPVIAVTSRTHTDYDRIVAYIRKRVP